MGITLRVDREPEDPSKLAVQLAEAYNAAATHQADAESFSRAERAERTKARDMRLLIAQVEEHRRKNGNAPRRRMDPFAEYDLAAMRAERALLVERAEQLRVTATEHAHEADQQRARARAIQARIVAAREGRA